MWLVRLRDPRAKSSVASTSAAGVGISDISLSPAAILEHEARPMSRPDYSSDGQAGTTSFSSWSTATCWQAWSQRATICVCARW